LRTTPLKISDLLIYGLKVWDSAGSESVDDQSLSKEMVVEAAQYEPCRLIIPIFDV